MGGLGSSILPQGINRQQTGYQPMTHDKNETTTCPECGKNAWRTEDRSTVTENVTLHHHSAHQFDTEITSEGALACKSVSRNRPDPEDLIHECRGPGCTEGKST